MNGIDPEERKEYSGHIVHILILLTRSGLFMNPTFSVETVISKSDGTNIVPRARPYTLADFEGCNIQHLIDSGAIKPDREIKHTVIDLDKADPETMKEEIRRLQALATGENPSLEGGVSGSVRDFRKPVRIGPRANTTASLERDKDGRIEFREEDRSEWSAERRVAEAELIMELRALKELISGLLLLGKNAPVGVDIGSPFTDELAETKESLATALKENRELTAQLLGKDKTTGDISALSDLPPKE